MKGLIIKDLLVLKSKVKIIPFILLCILAILAIYLLGSTGVIALNVFIPIYFCALAIPVFQEDEKAGWHTFVAASPLSKKQIVGSRYIVSFSIITTVLLGLLLFNVLYYFLFSDLSFSVHILTLFAALSIGSIYLSLLIPSIYYNGTNGSSIVMLIVILSSSGGAFLINSGKLSLEALVMMNPLLLVCCLLLGLILILSLSLFISMRIFVASLAK
ncbi:ABC-2 transporter permease [Paenibacillus sp. Leaf72]|uniref:ABC-2 transporter permease n=1 Tax=Paenibacillus sp. Leaf72 TaxID=1736234 RepID=UPI0006F94D7F|nr:ABC-2 transporter permease [Paenibacillus sp. Leaf72]KQO11036.1 hypothetical protein ASF12_11770 [Paenibacillus sp. Leaf72]